MVHCDYENVKQVLNEIKQQGLFKIGDYRVLDNVTEVDNSFFFTLNIHLMIPFLVT